ncbi:MAG: exodeoxyribonuclease VII small subunit [Anaerolineales bacterium]|jgi:exodeoxyribonuclease VII small subunit
MNDQQPVEALSFENAFQELEAIVNQLETEDRTLEEALQLFERGQALAKHCAELLDQAELKVQQIVGDELISFEGEV